MGQLYKTEPHYIRCIKPNDDKAELTFVPRNCFEQLTYSGVFEAVAIRKQGFPFRLPHKEFAERYGKLCKPKIAGGGSPKARCEKIIAQMKLDRFHKETKVEENKQAIRLLREADIFVEAQFIVGLDNETPETLEETYKMAWDWQPDLANWAMYTPWPFTPLFEEIKDQVEIHDFSKYNFVTPIMKPAAMERGELLNGVMKNYRRFYMQKALFHYPWRGTGFRRRYLLGCLYAFLRAGFKRRFYDLGKAGYWGPQTRTKVDWHFDESREAAANAATDWQSSADRAAQAAARREAVRKQMKERGDSRAAERHPDRIDVP